MTQFDELDPVEVLVIGKSVTKMTSDELISYIQAHMEARHGVELSVDGVKERSMLTWLKRVYKDDAGRIIKWIMYKHDGKDHRGGLVTFFLFQKAEKWWLDKIHLEMQMHQSRTRKYDDAPQLTPITALKGRRAQS